MSVIAIAEIFGISGRHDELLDLLRRTEHRALRLPGARRYEFAARLAAPGEFVLVSEWESDGDMAAYHRSDEFARYQATCTACLPGRAR